MKSKKWKERTDSVTHCISKHCLLINVVKGAGFKKMINAFDSRCEISGWNHYSRITLPSLQASVKQWVKQDVSALQCLSYY